MWSVADGDAIRFKEIPKKLSYYEIAKCYAMDTYDNAYELDVD